MSNLTTGVARSRAGAWPLLDALAGIVVVLVSHVWHRPAPAVVEAARYLIASVFALVSDFVLLLILVHGFGINPPMAVAVAYLVGLGVIYWLSIAWVFEHRRLGDRRAEFTMFAAVGMAGLMVTEIVIWMANEGFGFAIEASKVIAAGTSLCFNYVMRKFLLFSYRGR